MQHTIWTDNEGMDAPDDSGDGWTFELEVVESSCPVYGIKDGLSAGHATVRESETLVIKIDKATAAFIGRNPPIGVEESHGFHKGKDGSWRLDFDYVLSYQWRGMLQYFRVEIPEDGALDGVDFGKQKFRSWEFERKAEWKSVDETWDSMRV